MGGVWCCLIRADRLETIVLRLHLGLVTCAVLTMIMGSVSLLLVTPMLLLVSLRAAIIRYRWIRRHPESASAPAPPEAYTWLERSCCAALAIIAGLTLISVLAPITSWDAGAAHLAVASDYARAGKIQLLTGNVYSMYPQLLQSVFAYLFQMSGEGGVALFCWGYGVLACATMWVLGQGLADRRAGILSAVFLATAPFYISQASTVAIDLPFAATVLAAVVCWVHWRDSKTRIWLILMGVLLGSACGMRHTGYIVSVLCVMGVLCEGRSLRGCLLLGGVTLCAALPWLLRSYALVGNPFFPLLDSLFPQEIYAYHQETRLGQHETIREMSITGFISYPWSMVMHPERYDGWSANPGPWVWILGIPGLLLGGRNLRALGLFSLLGMSGFYFLQRLVRYAVPFYMPMMVVAGVTGSRLSRHSKALTALIVASLIYGCLLAAGSVYFKVPVALGLESREDYLDRRLDGYATFAWLNAHIPEGACVLTLDLRSYYIDRPTFEFVEQLHELKPLDFDGKVSWLAERKIRYVVLSETAMQYPFIAHTGIGDELNSWREAPDHFRLISTDAPIDPVYEVLWPEVLEDAPPEQP